MAYDASDSQMVLFGGQDLNFNVLDDTWTNNGTTWTEQSPATSPPARSDDSMAYDPAIGKIVLFGGEDNDGNAFGDTWTYDGTSWTEQSPATSPAPRSDGSMAYDPATGQMVLFGGLDDNGNILGDTWTYDGTTWTQQSVATSPPARDFASMSYDAATSQIVLFGGDASPGAPLDDTWTYNGTTWTQQSSATSPSARSDEAMSYDPITSQIVLFGGLNSASTTLGDTWTYNGTTWTEQSPATSPPIRSDEAMAYDPTTDTVILFGGLDGFTTALGDTWSYSGTGWSPLSPVERSDAQMTYDPSTGNSVLFGGLDANGDTLGDTWNYNGTTWSPSSTPGPPARAYASMTYDAATGMVVLFGGLDEADDAYGDTWVYNGTTWTQQSPATSPSARSDALMTYDPATGDIVLFGGIDENGDVLFDTWIYNGTTWTRQTPTAHPSARSDGAMAYDPATGKVVVFGGYDANSNPLGDTWTYNSTDPKWTQQTPATSPPARALSAMDYDSNTGQMVLFGGLDGTGTALGDTWTYNGTTWTQQTPTASPTARSDASMDYNTSAGRLFLFGGIDNFDDTLSDTWTYEVPLVQSVTFTTTDASATVGGATYTPSASATSGLGVTINLDADSTGCSLSNGVVSFTAAGTCVLDATQAGNADYAPAVAKQSIPVFDDSGVYVPLTPVRICDTRANNPSHLSGSAAQCGNGTTGETLVAGGTLTFDVAGDFSVPASNVTAVVLSVATANSKGPGHFTLFPAGATQPTAANLNYATGQVVPNLVEVGPAREGRCLCTRRPSSDAIVDLEGLCDHHPPEWCRSLQRLFTPARICDTRGSNPSGLSGGATQCNTNLAHGSPDNLIGPNNPLTINVEGNGGVPASGVSAVVLNVAVAKSTASGFVTVYPTEDTRPGASNVNYVAGVAVGNRVIVPVSASGQVTLYATAATDIIVDVSGWFTATGGTTGAEFTPEVDPVRICDTRGSNPSGLVAPYTQCNTNTAHPSPDNPLVAGTSDVIQSTGLGDVPTGAVATVINLADVGPTAGSNLTVYPSGTPPTTSDVNPPTGGVASNLVVATLTGSGSFEVANRGSGHTDIVIDIAGWYTTPA